MSHDPTLGARRARWALSFCLTLIFTNTNTDANQDRYTDKNTNTHTTLGARHARWALSFCLILIMQMMMRTGNVAVNELIKKEIKVPVPCC